MKYSPLLTLVAALLVPVFFHGSTSSAEDGPAGSQPEHRVLWYAKPASVWSKEALPIGNGRLGAMLFGGVTVERIQFNENSLWSGDNNWDGEYETGDRGFGSYRNFGDLFVEFGKSDEVQRDFAQRPRAGRRQRRSATPWTGARIPSGASTNPGELVVWQAELPEAKPVASYALTSANDMPARDPQEWVLAGSNDGKTWNELDRRVLDKPFESRHQTKQFTDREAGALPLLSLLVRSQGRQPFPGGRDRAGGRRVRRARTR